MKQQKNQNDDPTCAGMRAINIDCRLSEPVTHHVQWILMLDEQTRKQVTVQSWRYKTRGSAGRKRRCNRKMRGVSCAITAARRAQVDWVRKAAQAGAKEEERSALGQANQRISATEAVGVTVEGTKRWTQRWLCGRSGV